MMGSIRGGLGAVLTALLVLPPIGIHAQGRPGADSVTIVPGRQFKAGGVHRFFFGTRYRRTWATPVKIPVLDLKRFGGGLTPTRRGGGMQTASLRFDGADGKEYVFRSLSKDPAAILPPELRETVAADIVRDQISSAHPGAPLVAARLTQAAGVLQTTPVLVEMPDDPALGEFRATFGGTAGTIEERPAEGKDRAANFAGAREIVGTPELIAELDKNPQVRVDGPAFLLARLTDVLMGDWDRHADQWRWARIGAKGAEFWHPIARDRDQAFVRLDGFLLNQARRTAPQLLNFGPKYGSVPGATWNGRNLDRRFLTGLSRSTWDSVARALKARMTDPVIANAVRALPPEMYALDGARMEADLRARRDRLEEIEAKYYRLLAAQVDVFGTDQTDQVTVERKDHGAAEIVVAHQGAAYFRRTFHSNETNEVRVYLQDGGDRLTVRGDGRHPTVRVVGGEGDDEFTVGNTGGIKLYDQEGSNRADRKINTRPWTWRGDSVDPRVLPPRDWGRKTLVFATALYGPDVTALLGYAGYTDWFGFRRRPYSTRVDYGIEYSVGKNSFRGKLGVTRRFENSHGFVGVDALVSGIETLRWYGLGNESQATSRSDNAAFFRVNQTQLIGGLRIGADLGAQSKFSIGPTVRWSDTDLDERINRNRFIAVDRPYGTGAFGMVGMTAELTVDGRKPPRFATKGARLKLEASGYPAVWDATDAMGRLDGEASIAVAPSGRWQPSLNFMAGGVKTFGKVPFFIAPTLGGMHRLRGYRPDRFAGEDAAYGSAELRVPLTRIKLVVPGQQGIFGFSDIGRVFVSGETSDEWHSTMGGGVWFSFIGRDNVLLIGAGKPTKGNEGTRIVVGFGFPY